MNGDVANKIGTYTSALAAKANGVPFMLPHQQQQSIQIASRAQKFRSKNEVLTRSAIPGAGQITATSVGFERFQRVRAPTTQHLMSPSAELITGIITEKGIIPPDKISQVAPERQ